MALIFRQTKSGSTDGNYVPFTTILSAEVNLDFNQVYELVDGEIDSVNIANGGVGTINLADGAVTTPKLANAPNGVGTANINDKAVTAAKIADHTITPLQLAFGATMRTAPQFVSIPAAVGWSGSTAQSGTLFTAGPLTFTGGFVRHDLNWSVAINYMSALASTVTMRLYMDGGAPIYQQTFTGRAAGATDTASLNPIVFWHQPPAGAHTFTVTAQLGDAGMFFLSTNAGAWWIVEFA